MDLPTEHTTASEDTLYLGLNVQSGIMTTNKLDDDGNPTGGTVVGTGIRINWQNGPRGQEGTAQLAAPNGAFVEDVIYAAIQRLEFFNNSKYRSRENSMAITHLQEALGALNLRRLARQVEGKEGKHLV